MSAFHPLRTLIDDAILLQMKAMPGAVTLAFLALAASAATASPGPTCPLANIESARELHEVLSLRAVEVVKLAASQKGGAPRLAELLAPSASFSLGSGDVGRPLGTGIEGARALAKAMSADSFRYLGWDYMDGPAKPCSSQKVTVEFVDTHDKSVSRVEFTFEAGDLTNASGWQRSFQAGPLNSPPPPH